MPETTGAESKNEGSRMVDSTCRMTRLGELVNRLRVSIIRGRKEMQCGNTRKRARKAHILLGADRTGNVDVQTVGIDTHCRYQTRNLSLEQIKYLIR